MTEELSIDEKQKIQLRIMIAECLKNGILGSVKLKNTDKLAYFFVKKD